MVKIKTGYVNPKLGFWFASSAFKPQLYSSLPRTDHYPLFEDIIVPRLASRRPLLGGTALYRPLDHPEILRIARIAVKQYNRQQVVGPFHVWWPIAKEKGAQQILGSIPG
ncbi:uncharacterized protein LOC114293220 isoform X2 [Camellia sinensis]|uniref:uncharacterized protein LOC114293220 isoform X2 n=1 Tax=Camellia sinensis TaxID=4442 RepID=UPI001035AD86|nr:uncharacterized protein LOC114293220 isoform X2 [Camellia sinensis]